MDGNTLAARFVSQTRWPDLPPEVREKARKCLVDNLGATLAGTQTPVCRACTDFARDVWPGDEATILLRDTRSSMLGAAIANGAAGNGVDADDSAQYAWGHAGAQLFPTALVVSEALGLGGDRLLAAMVVGYEVAHRMGRCWHDDHSVYQACGSWGTVGCAAVAANLLDLTPEQCWHALGIADYHAPNAPMMRDVDHPAMVKHAIPWACVAGISAAKLARHGFTGIPSLMGADKYRDWVSDIGRHFIMVDGVIWKKKGFVCCGWAHGAAEAAHDLVTTHAITPDEIAAIRVEAFEEACRLGTKQPTTTEEAQFNLAWPVAAMVVDGEIGPRQTAAERLSDPRIRELAGKVEVVESEELNELCRLHAKGDPRGRFASIVTIERTDGRRFTSEMKDSGLNYGEDTWSRDDLSEKFRWLVATVLDEARIAGILETAWHLEEVADIRELTTRLKRM